MGVATTLIVNADDFGMSAAVNKAILKAFQEKLISSTSIMANMPGFDEAWFTLLTRIGYGSIK